jgi:hypothetical protein
MLFQRGLMVCCGLSKYSLSMKLDNLLSTIECCSFDLAKWYIEGNENMFF